MELYPIGWVGFIGIPGCSAMITGNFAVDISNANRCGDRVKIIGNFGKSRAPHHEMDPELTAKAMAYLDETYAACGRGFNCRFLWQNSRSDCFLNRNPA